MTVAARSTLIAGVLLALAAPARADDAAACDAAGRALRKHDLVRASIHATTCEAAGDPRGAALVADVAARASERGYSPVEIVTEPAGASVLVEPAPELVFTAPRVVWLPEGRHDVTGLVDGQPVARVLVIARDGDRALARLELPAPATPTDGTIDFGDDDGGGDVQHGPPPKVEHPSLLPDRYLRGVNARGPLDGQPAPLRWRRARPWGVGAGPALAVVDGEAGWGVALQAERRVRAGGRRVGYWIVPAVGGALWDAPGPSAGRVDQLHAQVTGEARAPVVGDLGVGVGGGLGWVHTFGGGPLAGDALAAIATADVGVGPAALAVRVEVPVVTGADVDAVVTSVLLGARW